MAGISRARKQDSGDKITALLFVAVAFAAVFVGVHKDDIVEGRLIEVLTSYVQDS
ncbi:hypothetical protein [Halovulum marinum]|uniref:hypothetical protein n=1 Tax=Halovulum marinum TaxID=2662447 RepID=UPI0012B345BC|nr:hypothetical protein [Halovulum marinum]